jgi:hypothetical protein
MENEFHMKHNDKIGKAKGSKVEKIPKKEKEKKLKPKDEEMKIQKQKKDFLEKENDNLIIQFGAEIYNCSKDIEMHLICPSLFKNHKMDEKIRTKMIDWMIEVLHAYKSDPQTLFISVAAMDLYLQKSRTQLENSHMHLIGVTCIYIASKYEDVIPIRMNSIHSKIAHKTFSETQIRQQERTILETIGWDLFYVTTYDFIHTYIFDFIHNNTAFIQESNFEKLIENFANVAVYLAKLCLHFEVFSRYL